MLVYLLTFVTVFSRDLSVLKTFTKKLGNFHIKNALEHKCISYTKTFAQSSLYMLNIGKRAFEKTPFLESVISKNVKKNETSLVLRNFSFRYAKVTDFVTWTTLNENITNLLLCTLKRYMFRFWGCCFNQSPLLTARK